MVKVEGISTISLNRYFQNISLNRKAVCSGSTTNSSTCYKQRIAEIRGRDRRGREWRRLKRIKLGKFQESKHKTKKLKMKTGKKGRKQ